MDAYHKLPTTSLCHSDRRRGWSRPSCTTPGQRMRRVLRCEPPQPKPAVDGRGARSAPRAGAAGFAARASILMLYLVGDTLYAPSSFLSVKVRAHTQPSPFLAFIHSRTSSLRGQQVKIIFTHLLLHARVSLHPSLSPFLLPPEPLPLCYESPSVPSHSTNPPPRRRFALPPCLLLPLFSCFPTAKMTMTRTPTEPQRQGFAPRARAAPNREFSVPASPIARQYERRGNRGFRVWGGVGGCGGGI